MQPSNQIYVRSIAVYAAPLLFVPASDLRSIAVYAAPLLFVPAEARGTYKACNKEELKGRIT